MNKSKRPGGAVPPAYQTYARTRHVRTDVPCYNSPYTVKGWTYGRKK